MQVHLFGQAQAMLESEGGPMILSHTEKATIDGFVLRQLNARGAGFGADGALVWVGGGALLLQVMVEWMRGVCAGAYRPMAEVGRARAGAGAGPRSCGSSQAANRSPRPLRNTSPPALALLIKTSDAVTHQKTQNCNLSSASSAYPVIRVEGGSPIFINNKVHSSGHDGIQFHGPSVKGSVEVCDVKNNAGNGIVISHGADPLLAGCKVDGNSGYGIVFEKEANGKLGESNEIKCAGGTSGAGFGSLLMGGKFPPRFCGAHHPPLLYPTIAERTRAATRWTTEPHRHRGCPRLLPLCVARLIFVLKNRVV